MKNFFVRALGAAFCFTALVHTAFAQDSKTNTGTTPTPTDAVVSTSKPFTKIIFCKNDALNVDVKEGSIDYVFFSSDATRKPTSTQVPGQLTDKNMAVDANLSKPGSENVELHMLVQNDEDVVVSVVPDAVTRSSSCTKELISTDNYAIIDVKTRSSVDYELLVRENAFSETFTKIKSGTIPAPSDLNLLNDMVIEAPSEAHEIKVVLRLPQGDSSASVRFSETKPQK